MGVEYCAYPSLEGESHLCDCEIATDRLASMLPMARHHTRHTPREDLLQLMEMIHHINGPIRRACAIGEAELKKLNISYAHYHIEMDRFILPGGCTGAGHLHMLHTGVKAVIRIMHQIQCKGEPMEAILLGFMNLLSNASFVMCLYENAQDDIKEKELINRSYI